MKLNERCSGPRFDPGQVHQKHIKGVYMSVEEYWKWIHSNAQ
jgi:hypothetical protein